MPRYPNGQIPEKVLVKFGVEHWTTPGTLVRWNAMVADVKKNEGVTLRITGGPNAYRNLAWQQFYWDTLPYPQAARPRTSSHGGAFKGKDTMALDVDNWALIGKAKFYAYARKHGFEPGYFSWEPWHIIDWNPWVVPAPSGGGSTPKPNPTPVPEIPEEEEEEMKGLFFTRASDKKVVYALFNDESGFWVEWTGTNPSNNNQIAQQWDTGSWVNLTESVAGAFKQSCADKRAGK